MLQSLSYEFLKMRFLKIFSLYPCMHMCKDNLKICLFSNFMLASEKVSEYDQEIPQSHTANQHMAL